MAKLKFRDGKGQFIEIPSSSDYDKLNNLPKINNIELKGNKTLDDLGMQSKLTDQDIYNAVKFGLIDNPNNLSDQEKLKIETWLGLSENYLTYYNITPYTVDGDYNPAHKKYVDTETKKLDERIDDVELSKFPNVTIFGTPTIQQGQISNFSLTDYLEFPFMVDFRGRSFEINFTFTTGTDIDNQQNILDSEFGLAFAIRDKHFVIALSYNGTSWSTEQTGSLILEPQKTYRVRISWTGLVYRVEYSIDGGKTYIEDIRFGGTVYPYPKQMYIGVSKLSQNFFKGSVNLNYADVYVEGVKIWSGLDDVGLQTRLALDLSNIDSAGITKVRELSAIPVIENANETELQPNVDYIFGEVERLELTLNQNVNEGIVNIYAFDFVSGETPTTLALPDYVKYANKQVPNIQANTIYEATIKRTKKGDEVNYVLVLGEA